MKTHSVRKRVSILEPLKDDIFELKRAGYSVRQIAEFLTLNDVVISQNALPSFIKTRQKTEAKIVKKNSGSTTVRDSSVTSNTETLTSSLGHVPACPEVASNEKRELVKVNGRVIDVNYKPS